MVDLTKYTGLITNQHADKARFVETVELSVSVSVDLQNILFGLAGETFDLDSAVGVQLDIIGLWIGVGRRLNTPLTGVYFSLDIEGVGFDQGVWKGEFDPDSGVVILDDETYRTLLYAKIASNNWDGTMEGSQAVLDLVFPGSFIQDNQDMSMLVGITGQPPPPIVIALLTQGYINIKPSGVRINIYIIPTEPGGPLFGFDSETPYISGFDSGVWGTFIPV